MKHLLGTVGGKCLVVGALLAMPAGVWGSAAYVVGGIDLPAESNGATPLAIGNGGHVAMFSARLADVVLPRAAFMYRDGNAEAIAAPAGMVFVGSGVNGLGAMGGMLIPSSLEQPAEPVAAYYQNGEVTILPAPSNLPTGPTAVSGINDVGEMVGWWQDGVGAAEAILWANGQAVRLNEGQPGVSFAHAINNRGTVVGWVTSPDGVTDVVVWRAGAVTRIDGIPNVGLLPFINNNDQVLIPADLIDADGVARTHWYIWQDGTSIELPALAFPHADGNELQVAGFNDQGEIVGQLDGHAVVYAGGSLVDLNALIPADSGWRLTAACGLNNAGQIVGIGMYQGEDRSFLLTPTGGPAVVPEAGLGWVVGVVMASAILRKRRAVRREICA